MKFKVVMLKLFENKITSHKHFFMQNCHNSKILTIFALPPFGLKYKIVSEKELLASMLPYWGKTTF